MGRLSTTECTYLPTYLKVTMENTNVGKFDEKLKSSGSPWSPQVNTLNP